MSDRISFFIPGAVAPCVRMTGNEAKFSQRGRSGNPKYAAKNASIQRYFAYKDEFKLRAKRYATLFRNSSGKGPIRLTCEFIMNRPKSVRKVIKYHTKRPDLTNLIKTVEDAMNGLFYLDDSQIAVYGPSVKRYPVDGEEPGVVVTLERLSG